MIFERKKLGLTILLIFLIGIGLTSCASQPSGSDSNVPSQTSWIETIPEIDEDSIHFSMDASHGNPEGVPLDTLLISTGEILENELELFSVEYYPDDEAQFIFSGKFRIDDNHLGLILECPHEYAWYNQALLIYNPRKDQFLDRTIWLATYFGDGGEQTFTQSWIGDFHPMDGIELATRHLQTYLKIDASEEDRQTTVSEVKLFSLPHLNPIQMDNSLKQILDQRLLIEAQF